jgi:hypothetical protein
MEIYYVTYKKNGISKRGVLSEVQYKTYSSDNSITELEIHPTQQLMEEHFSGAKNNKKLLFG